MPDEIEPANAVNAFTVDLEEWFCTHSHISIYIHPWELDPGQPRIGVGRLGRFRHYHNLESAERKLEQLLLDYTFTSIRQLLGRTRPAAE